jgi:hypothetical protein
LERLKALRNEKGDTGSLVITDLLDEDGRAAGTRVEIKFPALN